MNYKLEDIIDIKLLQNLQEKLNVIYSFPSAIIDNEGKILTAVAWQDICTKFHRMNPLCEKECIKSDQYILEHLHEANPAVSYQCPHGMIDNAVPIVINGKHLGNFFTGQFFLKKPDLVFFKKQAKKYGFDEKAYLEAVKKVPIWTKEKLAKYLDFIIEFIEIIADLGIKNLKEIEINQQLNEEQEKLQKSEEKYRSLINLAQEGIWVIDKHNVTSFVNPSMARMLGYSADEMLGKSLFDFMDEIGVKIANENLERRHAGLKDQHDFEFICKNGDRIITTLEAAPIMDKSGNYEGSIAGVMNITERKQAENTLRNTNTRHSAMIENIGDVIAIMGTDGIVKYQSPNIEKLLGWKPEEIIGTISFEKVYPEDIKRIQKEFNKILEKESPSVVEFRHKCKDGTYKWIELTAINRINDPVIKGVLINYHDITERKKSELEIVKAKEKAEESENKFRTVFKENNSVQLLIEPETGKIIDVNQAACKFYGYSFLELTSMEIQNINQFSKKEIEQEMQKAKIRNLNYFEFKHKLSNGTIKDVEVYSNPIIIDNKTLLISIIHDITPRKLAEQELIASIEKAEENEEKYRQLYESNLMPISIFDTETLEFLSANKAFTEKYGYSKEELLEMTILDIRPESEFEKLKQSVYTKDNGLENKGVFLHQKKNGEIIHVEIIRYSLVFEGKNAKLVFSNDVSKLKHSEAELIKAKEKAEESEKKYRNIFENAQDVFFEVAIDGTILEVSPSIEFLTKGQYKPKDLIGKSIYDFYSDPEDREDLLSQLQKTGNVIDFEIIFKNRDGSLVPCSISSKIQFDIQGQPIKIIGSMRDNSDRKKAEKALRKSEMLFSQLFEQSIVSTQLLDKKGNCINVNPTFCKLFGVTKDDMMHYKIFKDEAIIKSNAYDHLIDVFENKNANRWNNQFDIALASESSGVKTIKPVTIFLDNLSYPILDSKNKLQYVVIQHNDITVAKEAEEALQKSEAKLSESLIDLQLAQKIASIGNWHFDPEIGIPVWSDEVYKIYDRDKKLGPPHIDDYKKMYDEEQYNIFIKAFSTAIAEGVNYNIILKFNSAKNKEKWIRAICQPDTSLKSNKGYFLRGTIQDITSVKETEIELTVAKDKATESDRLKSAFLANMSHEIRTPMNGILGFTSLLKEVNLTGYEQKKYIDIIEKSGDRMLNTINDIIDISRIESGEVEMNIKPTNINTQLESLCKFFKLEAKTKNISLIYKLGLKSDSLDINTDPVKLDAIFTNLIKNALKFTHDGFVECGYTLEDKVIHFYVKDTGVGIESDKLESIFERFIQEGNSYTRTHQGSGLGLSIVKAYVELLDGKVWAESKKGNGSTFHFTIPYKPTKKASLITEADVEATKDKKSNFINKTILIAEDDESNYEFIKVVIESFGINNILWAENGEKSIKLCKENSSIDLVLMDINMPIMNGYEATKTIKAFRPELPIIAQTAYALSGDQEKSLEAGCDDYITKPIKKGELLEKMEKFLK